MRLYLSSFRLGTAPEHLVRLVGLGARVAVVANAIDDEPADVRAAKVDDEVRALERLGLRAEEVDLRDLAGLGRGEVLTRLSAYDGLWVRGGNVFVLRVAMARSGADDAVVALLADDRLVYAGYSAGPCVLAPSLEGLESVDDVEGPRTAYGSPAILDGLGVLDHAVVPHCGNPTHPESAACDAVADAYAAAGIAHLRLRDGEALVVDGESRTVVGRPAEVADLLYPAAN
jgi:dipeptidase E